MWPDDKWYLRNVLSLKSIIEGICDDFIAEHKQAIITEAEEQAAAEIGKLKRKLAEETRPLVAKIATEQRINKFIDGV